jgi:hypothetical protein
VVIRERRRRAPTLMRKLILISAVLGGLAVPAQALATTPVIGTQVRSDSLGFRGSIYFNPAFHTLGPNGEVVAHFNHAQRLALVPY